MNKKIIFVLLIFISCSKTYEKSSDHTGNYTGRIITYTTYNSDTFQTEIEVSPGNNSNELKMIIPPFSTIATLTGNSFNLEPSLGEFAGGNGIFAGDTMHISYNTFSGYTTLYLGILVR